MQIFSACPGGGGLAEIPYGEQLKQSLDLLDNAVSNVFPLKLAFHCHKL